MKKYVIPLATVLFSNQVYADQYLCTAQKSSGFVFNSKGSEWIPVVFDTTNKYVIRLSPKSNKYQVDLIRGGVEDKIQGTSCKEGFSDGGVLTCDIGLGGTYIFNKKNLRVIRSFMHGYWNIGLPFGGDTDKNGNTPFMEIGTCISQENG